MQAENAPGGGLVVVTVHDDGGHYVYFSHQRFAWHAVLIASGVTDWVDVLLDRNGVLWLLYAVGPETVVKANQHLHVDATASDDGSLWGVSEVGNEMYVTRYTDQKYVEDMRLRKNLRMRNEAVFFGTCLLIATFWFFFKRSLLYGSLQKGLYFGYLKEYARRTQKNMKKEKNWEFFFRNLYCFFLLLIVHGPSVDFWLALLGFSAVFWMLSGCDSLEKRGKNHFTPSAGSGHRFKRIPYHDHIEIHMRTARKNMGRIPFWISFGTYVVCTAIFLDFNVSDIRSWLFLIGFSGAFWMLSAFYQREKSDVEG